MFFSPFIQSKGNHKIITSVHCLVAINNMFYSDWLAVNMQCMSKAIGLPILLYFSFFVFMMSFL